jgi:ParB/RepB/Spo0J family partition protein
MTTTTTELSETVIQLPADRLAAHPDNVRASLGDLRELSRSIKAQGIIVPLLVLPANDDGVHLIVAGHRRYAAALTVEVTTLPVLVRDLTPTQVLDAMLVENSQRTELSLVESIRAVARYQFLDPTDTPTKISRRIGRSASWVKSRLALAVLPVEVMAMLDSGTLTVTQAEALTTLIEEGDDTVIECAREITAARSWREPGEQVEQWRKDRTTQARRDEIITKLDRHNVHRFDTTTDAKTAKAVPLDGSGLGLDKDATRAHRHEPCHAVVVERRWNGTVEVTGWCIEPKRHRATPTRPAVSEIAIERPGPQSPAAVNETERAHRQARKQRHTAATAMVAKGRWSKGDGLQVVARVWCDTIGQPAARKACEFLSIELSADDGSSTGRVRDALVAWLTDGGEPARLLVALAGGELETASRQADPLPAYTKADASAMWLALLTGHGGYVSEGHDLP